MSYWGAKNVWLDEWAANGGFDDGGFIIWKGGILEIVIEFALSQSELVFNGHASKLAEGWVWYDWGKFIVYLPVSVFMIDKDNNSTFGSVYLHVRVAFYSQVSH